MQDEFLNMLLLKLFTIYNKYAPAPAHVSSSIIIIILEMFYVLKNNRLK